MGRLGTSKIRSLIGALLACALLGALAVLCSGCSSTTALAAAGTASAAACAPGHPVKHLKVGLVTDTGGLSDRSFNALANQGLQRAVKQLHITGTVVESSSSSDYEPNLGLFAEQGYNVIIGVGFLMGDSIKAVANRSPHSCFAIIDFSFAPKNVANVRGLVFKEEDSGYLVGALAGMAEEQSGLPRLNSQHVVSAVGGQQIPAVDHYIAGYQAGVKAFCKDCKVLVSYTQDFVDQTKCKEQATDQIHQGSDIVFQVAGGCGLGALDAAKANGVWGIGVDADQSYLGPHILTSALKRTDVAVYDTIQAALAGKLQTDTDGVYGYANGGAGIGPVAPAAKKYLPQLTQVEAQLKSGKIVPPEQVAGA